MTRNKFEMLLVVEDNAGDARLLREMLDESGSHNIKLERVERLSEAEARLAKHPVDIVVLDLGLPDSQGLGAIRRVRAVAPRTPLVVLTGLDDEALAAAALQEGAQDYLIKGQIETRGLLRSLRYAVERKTMEEALFVAQERAEVTLNCIGDAVVSTDSLGNIQFLNAAAENLTGWPREQAAGRRAAEVLQILDAGSRIALPNPMAIETDRDRLGPVPPDGLLIGRDELETPIERSVAPIYDRAGKAEGAVIVFRDVTQRRRVDRDARKSEERFRRLFEANTIGITIAEFSGRILEANDAFLAMLGYSGDELLSGALSWDGLTPPEHLAHSLASIEELQRTGTTPPWEKEYLHKDGTRVPVLVGIAVLEASEGTCITYIVDLSARRLLEDQLRQAQKMEAVGQLAGGIAHDFNNLLTVILGHADLLDSRLAGSGPARESIEEIRNAGRRAASLTSQLLAFSRRQVLEPKVLDVNALVENLKKMLHRMIGEDIDLVTALDPEIGCVRADAGQIEQILMNLAVNARDAMPKGGRLTIESSNVDLGEGYALEHQSVRPGRYVMLAVSDTGTGMSAETKTHMFEPFYTTKGSGRGTGLGLATVYGIVKQSGGYVWVYSELGHGTALKVYLPRVDEKPDAALDMAPAADPAHAMETLLLVEDEPAVRALTRSILESRGYTVLEASGALEALETARLHAGPIHLLLTDVVMPLMGGSDLASRLSLLRPETRVVYMSGYTDDAIVRQGLLTERVRFLQKPFNPEGLARKVREALS